MLVGTVGLRIGEMDLIGTRRWRRRLGRKRVVLRICLVGAITVIDRCAPAQIWTAIRGWDVRLVGICRLGGLRSRVDVGIICVLWLLLMILSRIVWNV